MDDADRAQERAEIELERACKAAGRLAAQGPRAVGWCLGCEEPLQDGRFCNAACRDDWEMRAEFAYRNRAVII